MAVERKSLFQLFVPICLETLMYMLTGMVDTLMLSTINDQAVGAVGTSNTYIGMFILMFSIVSTGMMAVMTQNIGAGRTGVAYQARNLGLIFNLILGFILSLFLFTSSNWLLVTIGISEALEEYASTYMKIVGGAVFLNALIPIGAGYLRAFGHTKYPLWGTIIGNIVNVLFNSIFLFYFKLGVEGVAYATVLSRLLNAGIVLFFGAKLIKAKESPDRISNKTILLQILRIGVPSATETLLYSISVTLAIRFLNQMDPMGFNVAARAYAAQIANFSSAAGNALAQANGIMTGWRVGQRDYEACKKGTKKALLSGLLVALIMGSVIGLFSPLIVPLFTDDKELIHIVCRLIWIDVILEFGRVTNLIYGNALKTCGDAIFPVILGVVFMLLFMVGGTYVLGIRLNLLVTGCYIALATDECSRGIGMILRWRSGKWMGKGLI